ncbi:MAG: hypothetical protein ACRCYU_21920 [Nocardioides sp.]
MAMMELLESIPLPVVGLGADGQLSGLRALARGSGWRDVRRVDRDYRS